MSRRSTERRRVEGALSGPPAKIAFGVFVDRADSQKWLSHFMQSHFMSQLGVFALAEDALVLALAARSAGGSVISIAQMAAGRMYMEAR
jgi:hypothetical protein